jgi:hypothetical protein
VKTCHEGKFSHRFKSEKTRIRIESVGLKDAQGTQSILVDHAMQGKPNTVREEFERVTLAVDSVKHITTLATGTIVLIATLLDKFPKPIADHTDLNRAIGSMLLCVRLSFVCLWGLGVFRYWKPETKIRGFLSLISVAIYFSFLLELVSLWEFARMNL